MSLPAGLLLALDASTAQVGFGIFDKSSSQLIKLDHLSLPVDKDLIGKVEYFKNWLEKQLLITYPLINEVAIEESFSAFFGGRSSIHTTMVLNQANFGYRYVCHILGLQVNTITVSDARKYSFKPKLLSKAKSGGKNQKQQMFDNYVFLELGKDYFPTKILKSGPRKGEEVLEDFCLDMSDAYVVGKGFLNKSK